MQMAVCFFELLFTVRKAPAKNTEALLAGPSLQAPINKEDFRVRGLSQAPRCCFSSEVERGCSSTIALSSVSGQAG